MKNDTLVLNRSYVPTSIVSWKKGISLIYQDAARALDRDYVVYEFEDWLVFSSDSEMSHGYHFAHSSRWKIAVPEIIVLRNYDRLPSRDVKYSRQTIFERDAFRCAYCGKEFRRSELTIDHIVPRAKGGKSSFKNTISACVPCNSKKGHKTLEESGMKLHFKPKKPKWISPLNKVPRQKMLESWKTFLNRALVDMG